MGFKNDKLKRASIIMISIILFMSSLFMQNTEAAGGIPIPICLELNSFSSSNVGGDSASTLLWARGQSSVANNVLRVVSKLNSQNGTVVRRNKINLNGGFSTYFVMNLNSGSTPPADGLVFIVQNNPTPVLGAYGGGLGYRGISNSFGVEFDIYENPSTDAGYGVYDPDANHVAIVQNGSNNHHSSDANTISSPSFSLYGQDIHVWVDYDTDGLLTVSYGTSNVRSSATTLSKNVGTSLNNKDVYVGFSASTGGSTANHDIKKWYFKDSYVSGGLQTTAGTYTQGANGINITLQNSGGSTVTTNPSKANIIVKDANNNNMLNETASIYIDNVLVTTVNTGATGTEANYNFSGLSVGSHTIKAVAASGGATNSTTFSVTDITKPTIPTLTFSGYTENTWTNSTVSFNVGGSTDSETGVSYYQYSINNGSSWTTGNTGTISAEGTYTVLGRAVDGAGNISDSSVGKIVKIDKTKPTISSFSINDSATYTNVQTVDLDMVSSDSGGSGVSTMIISNNSDFSVSTDIPYATSYTGFSLSDNSENKTVYLKVKDDAGNESAVSTDSIIFDGILPSVSLSMPNTYSATKGTTVEYIATYSDGNGIKNITLNSSDVVLSAIGTADVSKLSVNVEDMPDPNQKKDCNYCK